MKAILIDSEIEVRDLIEFYLTSTLGVDVHPLNTVAEAIPMLKAAPNSFDYVISKVKGVESDLKVLFEFFRAGSLTSKIVICDNELPDSDFMKLNRSMIQFVHRPNYISEFQNIFGSRSEVSGKISRVETDYRLISFSFLSKTPVAPAELFVRISAEHFLAVIRKGDSLDAGDTEKYQRKGLAGLYLLKADFDRWMTDLMSDLNSKLAHVKSSTPEAAADLTIDLQAAISEVARTLGVSPQLQGLVKGQMDLHSHQLKKYGKLGDLLSRYLKEGAPYAYVHSAMTGMIAGHIAKALDWESELTLGKLSLAAILHDVAVARPEHATIQVESELFHFEPPLSTSEMKAWREHPVSAGMLVRDFPDLSKESAQIIEQHHEFPDGSGLRGLQEHQITPLAAAFIVAHDFANYFLMLKGTDAVGSYTDYRKGLFSKGTFKRALAALQ